MTAESNAPASSSSQDYISLSDVFVALIAKRRLFVGTTAVGLVLSLTLIFALPALGLQVFPGLKYQLTESIDITPWPPEILEYQAPATVPFLVAQSTSLKRVATVYRASFSSPAVQDFDDEDLATMLKNTFLGKQFKVVYDETRNVIDITLIADKKDEALSFLKSDLEPLLQTLEKMQTRSLEQAVSRLAIVVQQMEAGGNANTSRTDNSSGYVELKTKYLVGQQALKGDLSPARLGTNLTITKDYGMSRVLLSVLGLLVSLVLGVLFVIVSHAAQTARANVQFMERVTRAWKRS